MSHEFGEVLGSFVPGRKLRMTNLNGDFGYEHRVSPVTFVYADPRGLPSTAGRRPSLPSRGTSQAAGYDVQAFLPEQREMLIKPLHTVKVPTGLFFAIPTDSAMLICSRSGLASKGVMVANGPGILDSDYRGELLVLLTYVAAPDAPPFVIKHGDRIAQLLFTDPVYPEFDAVALQSDLPVPDSNRTGGFGSTGQ
jgi:dUTP pyrophosphatase